MCTPDDFPPYDEPLEDSVDWPALRRISRARRGVPLMQLEDERRRGIPPMEEDQKRVVRDMAVEARRGRTSVHLDGVEWWQDNYAEPER